MLTVEPWAAQCVVSLLQTQGLYVVSLTLSSSPELLFPCFMTYAD